MYHHNHSIINLLKEKNQYVNLRYKLFKPEQRNAGSKLIATQFWRKKIS